MQAKVLKANISENIKIAANLILRGKLVAFPTETVYGLGADATNSEAVSRIFTVKERPAFDPLIVHVASMEMLCMVAKGIPDIAWTLIDAFWPGPLTLVLSKKDEIPDIVTAGLPTIAVRMPRNKVALALIKESGVPIAAPSANSFSRPSPTSVNHVIDDLGSKIDLILDDGPAQIGIESTVLDLTCSPPSILRPGGVSRESLERILRKVSVSLGNEDNVFRAPGQMKQHYAPRAKMMLFVGKRRKKVIISMRERIKELGKMGKVGKIGVMVPEEYLTYFNNENVVAVGLGSLTSTEAAAKKLFETMRALDKIGVNYILALAPSKKGIGLAIFDRLFKAAGSQLIEVD
ncbi:MAG: threonylcarbamoyl-AMP synthase [Chloroflexi bacterium]|nr:threonylcarbamoyl-AMP synthase [Chloroflexota bacterium]